MENDGFKICPFCKEKIRKEAVKCRFCGEWIERREQTHVDSGTDGKQPPPLPQRLQKPFLSTKQIIVLVIVGVLLALIFLFSLRSAAHGADQSAAVGTILFTAFANTVNLIFTPGALICLLIAGWLFYRFKTPTDRGTVDDGYELLERAARLEREGRLQEALNAYQDIASRYSHTAAGQDAQKSIANLQPLPVKPEPPMGDIKKKTYTFREITSLTKLLKILLGAGIVWALVSLFSAWLQFELLLRGTFSQSEGQVNDTRQQLIGLVYLFLYLVTVVVFARWIYRANRNIRALGAKNMRFTPGWAVGYFFVPIIWLWRPYQAMKDLWRASKNPTAWHDVPTGAVLRLWWTLWLVSNFLGVASFRSAMQARDIISLQASTMIDMMSDIVDIPLGIVAIMLVSQIYASQASQKTPDTTLAPR